VDARRVGKSKEDDDRLLHKSLLSHRCYTIPTKLCESMLDEALISLANTFILKQQPARPSLSRNPKRQLSLLIHHLTSIHCHPNFLHNCQPLMNRHQYPTTLAKD
jgi:hypothetical protein